MPQTLRFKGGKELARELNKLDTRMRRNIIREAVREGADVVIEEAQIRAPVRTGQLRDSIKRQLDSKESTKYAAVYKVGWSVFYGHLIEFGIPAYGVGAQPFLRPAFEAKRGEAQNAMAAVVRLRLRRFGLKF